MHAACSADLVERTGGGGGRQERAVRSRAGHGQLLSGYAGERPDGFVVASSNDLGELWVIRVVPTCFIPGPGMRRQRIVPPEVCSHLEETWSWVR